MIATCKTCKQEIQVKDWAPMTEEYICDVCQAKYERCFYLHLVRRRIEQAEEPKIKPSGEWTTYETATPTEDRKQYDEQYTRQTYKGD